MPLFQGEWTDTSPEMIHFDISIFFFFATALYLQLSLTLYHYVLKAAKETHDPILSAILI